VTEAANGISHVHPHFLPDGKRLLFFLDDLSSHQAEATYAIDLETRRVSLVAREASEAFFVQPGYLVFVRGGNLMVQPFDPSRLRTSGEARPIADNVAFHANRVAGAYAFSETGLLVFQSGSGALRTQLTWFNAGGQKLGTLGEPAGHTFVALSPDGRRVLSEVLGANGLVSLRMHDLEHGASWPFTSGPGIFQDPVWSPDAKRVVYDDRIAIDPDYHAADGMADYPFHWKAADGSEEARNPLAGGIPYSWSPDGRTLAFMSGQIGTPMSLLRLPGYAKPYPFIVTPAGDIRDIPRRGSFSPDGRWFCYLSDETGRYELYVAPFPGPGGKWRVSSDGADDPQWVRGGAQLVYINNQHRLVAVDIRASGQRLEVGHAHVLFGGRPLPALPSDASSYAPPVYLTADGNRVLLPVPLEGSALSLTVVSNWIAQLKK
jgi:dipeptidyl aminopeptidase/acylaminoacyl peptidase